MTDALATLKSAIALFQQKTPTEMKSYFTDLTGSAVADADVTKVQNALRGAWNSADALRSAILGGSWMYVDTAALTSGTVWTDSVYSWPTGGNSTTVQIKPSQLYSDDLLNPAKLFVTSANGGLQVFGYNSGTSVRTALGTKDSALYTEAQLAIDWGRVLQFFIPGSSASIPVVADGGSGHVYLSINSVGTPQAFTNSQWSLFSWLMGN